MLRLCAEAAKESYSNWPRLAGYHATAVSWGSTQCFVLHSDERIVVAFRGTQPLSTWDWVSDFRALFKRPIQHKYAYAGQYHRGFTRCVNDVYVPLVEHLRVAIRRGAEKICITGHSLGGALAQVFLARLALENPDVMRRVENVIVFGSPMVGNHAAASWLNKTGLVLRVEAKGDIVPRLPPWLLGYRRAGAVLTLPSAGLWKFEHPMASYLARLPEC